MLDKSPELVLDNNLEFVKNQFELNVPSIVLNHEPFHKTEFLNRLMNSIKNPIIFVDMDLLYTGYVESGMMQEKKNVTIFHPDNIDWKEKLSEIICRVSKEKFLVIIDSFNGVYNLFNDLESARFVNSCIMLLSSLGKQGKSSIIVTAMARKKDGKWILSPRGKQILKSEKTGVYFLEKVKNNLIFTNLGKRDSQVFKIEQEKS